MYTAFCLATLLRGLDLDNLNLSSAVSAAFHAGHHGALIIRTTLRHLSRLLRGPLLALRFISRLLLDALTIFSGT